MTRRRRQSSRVVAAAAPLLAAGLLAGPAAPVVPATAAGPPPGSNPEPRLVVDDMELPAGALPRGDVGGVPVGWYTFSDGASSVAVDTTDAPPEPRPGAPAGNRVLQVDAEVAGFAGVVHAFESADATDWLTQDWSAYAGVAVWLYGTGSGTGLFLDLLDNRSPGSVVDDAERFVVNFTDDWVGWELKTFAWEDFARKEIGNGAPDDGLTLTEVNGWALGALGTPARTWYLDDVQLVGSRPLAVRFDRPVTEVVESPGTSDGPAAPVGAGAAATVDVVLTRPADERVTVAVATSASTDRTATENVVATPERDYLPAAGTLVFEPGETRASLRVPVLDDDVPEVDESFQVVLSDARVGTAELPLGPERRGDVRILDDDPTDPLLLEDAEAEHAPALLTTTGGAEVAVREIAAGDPDARPGQDAFERVLDVTGSVTGGEAAGSVGRALPLGRDLSDGDELEFWLRGTGDGAELTLTLLDGRAPDPGPDGWELTWADEFDGPAGAPPDPDSWTYETGGWGWGNQELQYYTDSTDNAALDGDGRLVLTTREVADPAAADLPCWYGPCTHTSARLVTEGKQEVAYGRIEARIRVPEGSGIWPAFWSLGNDFRAVGWPQTGEIDVMEFVGREPTSVFGTIHGPGYAGGASFGSGPVDVGEPVGSRFREFAVEWQPGEIRWYLDGEQYHEAAPADVAPDEWVFDHPFTLLLNTAVGGNFGGPLGDDLTFPQEHVVDYVGVYQAPDTAERFEAMIVDDVAGWRKVRLPVEAFARSADQPAGAPDDGLGLDDVWGWQLSLPDGETRSLDGLRLRDTEPEDRDGDGFTDPVEDAVGSDPRDPASVPTCRGEDVTVIGTLGRDVLVGTRGRDVVHGVDGRDVIVTSPGDDVVCGGAGDDVILLGAGDDVADGGPGDDVVLGARGSDELTGGAGDDRLLGGPGSDRLDGGEGEDLVDGGSGRDVCSGEATVRCEPRAPGAS